jgi:hypothetical protein
MSAGRKRAAGAKDEGELLTALRFVMAAQYPAGDARGKAAYQQHCRFQNGYVIAFNGVLAAGHPVSEEMYGCPNTHLFIRALEKVRGAHSLTLLDNNSLSINGGAYRALVPCVAPVDIEGVIDDGAHWDLGDEFRTAGILAKTFSTDGAQTVLAASIITRSHSLVGTDGSAMVEAYHGWGMPEGLLIPVSFIDALAKVTHKIVKFGFTENRSLTIYFENGAWLRSQLYQEGVPNVGKVLDTLDMSGVVPVPEGFDSAVDAVSPFSETGAVFIEDNEVRSHETKDKGAQHACDGLPFSALVSVKYLTAIRPFTKKVDFTTYPNARIVCLGDNVRAVVSQRAWK